MKKLSAKALIAITAISLILTALCTYLWATVAGPVGTVCAVLVFVFAASTVICINSAANK